MSLHRYVKDGLAIEAERVYLCGALKWMGGRAHGAAQLQLMMRSPKWKAHGQLIQAAMDASVNSGPLQLTDLWRQIHSFRVHKEFAARPPDWSPAAMTWRAICARSCFLADETTGVSYRLWPEHLLRGAGIEPTGASLMNLMPMDDGLRDVAGFLLPWELALAHSSTQLFIDEAVKRAHCLSRHSSNEAHARILLEGQVA